MTDSYVYLITALLPLAASMVVVQVNPYHALIIRGILGAVAALVYAVLGAADVALTEALVGTMLAITLYAVAVRSSLVILTSDLPEPLSSTPANTNLSQASQAFNHLLTDLRAVLAKHYMRLELVSFTDAQSLQQALADKDIHATCVASRSQQDPLYCTTIRIQRLYEILQAELSSPMTTLTYANALEVNPRNGNTADLEEAHS
jgi:putative multicomponent Na+:H+ antiporter subunit B